MKQYNFQDYLLLEIESNGKRQFDSYFHNEYMRINETNSTTVKPQYTVNLEIVDQLPENLPSDTIIRKVKFKKLFTFQYAITGHGTKQTKIYFKDHIVAKLYVVAIGVFIQAQVLEPVMYLSFLKQGIFLMHSAGVSKNGLAYVFPAEGGTGKTTTCMSLINNGYDFLGDDLLIIDPKKKLVFPYPRPLHIFTYNVKSLKGAKIPLRLVSIIYFKNLLRFFLEKTLKIEFLISTRIHADEILPNLKLSPPAKLHNVVFLKKIGCHKSILLNNAKEIKENAKNIVVSADLNDSLFTIINDKSRQKEIHNLEVDIASKILKSAQYFGYLNTRTIDLDKIQNHIEDVEA